MSLAAICTRLGVQCAGASSRRWDVWLLAIVSAARLPGYSVSALV